jgi:formate dehydrogenase major subunit
MLTVVVRTRATSARRRAPGGADVAGRRAGQIDVAIRDGGRVANWPFLRQLATGDARATGAVAMSDATRRLAPKNAGVDVARSVCPYCGVGCGQLIFHRGNELVSIEGDPGSPISAGHLCPKGAASFELLTHAQRLQTVRYRAPFSTSWTTLPLETAMDMIADRVWETRARTFVEKKDGKPLMQCASIAHLGGATLDNEENYLIKKLFAAGLGIVCVSNQARI